MFCSAWPQPKPWPGEAGGWVDFAKCMLPCYVYSALQYFSLGIQLHWAFNGLGRWTIGHLGTRSPGHSGAGDSRPPRLKLPQATDVTLCDLFCYVL